jgi:DNA helicase-2/ATP-dependent DNA helicase PcrA
MAFKPTKEQKKVLAHDHETHARVLAGPGTGKSATVVQYIESLHARKNRPKIRLLTFTRAATSELAQKIGDDELLKPSTVHSFSISVLLKNPGSGGFPEPLRIADDWETGEIVNPSLQRELGISIRDVRDHIREMAAGWESLDEQPASRFTKAETNQFLAVWSEHRHVWGYTLLAELPFRLREALSDHKDLKGCSFDLLVVDEYQDLNACDLELIRILADERGTTVLAVGDDDQSIYSFRHAAPAGIRRFPDDYPGCGNYTLSHSLRCGRNIIGWATHVIQFNRDRPKDRPLLEAAEKNPDGTVGLLSFASETAEARGIANLVRTMIKDGGLKPSEILVLLRSDFNQCFSGPIKEELDKLTVSTADAEWVKLLLARPGNRRSLALFRLLVNDEDSLAWGTLLRTTDGIGEGFIDSIYTAAKKARTNFAHTLRTAMPAKGRAANLSTALIDQVDEWLAQRNLPDEPEDGWAAWMLEQDLPAGFGFDESCEVLLRDVAELVENESSLDRFLGQISPLGMDFASARSEGVRIMSLAKSKGLTVRGTIIAGCEEGIIPHESAQPDEEARLMYVGMTRAREYLYCTWARRRTGPTARVGRKQVGARRTLSRFLQNGPVKSRPGDGKN